MKRDIYYDGSADFEQLTTSGKILIDVRKRSKGRTSWWINKLTKRALKNPHNRFLFIRRSAQDVEDVVGMGFAKNLIITDYYGNWYRKRGYTFKIVAEKIYIHQEKPPISQDILVGYIKSLNNPKGLDADDVDFIMFDEFIAVSRLDYKGGCMGTKEPVRFMKLVHTIFRRRQKCWVVLLGNDDTPTNPYNEYFKIPYGAKRYTDGNVIYRYDPTPSETDSTAAVLSKYDETAYKTEVAGNGGAVVPDYAILDKPPSAVMLFTIKHQTTYLTVWYDDKGGLLYVHDNYALDKSKPVYCAFNDDMTVDTNLLNCSLYPQVKMLKESVQRNLTRYNSQRTAQKMIECISLIR